MKNYFLIASFFLANCAFASQSAIEEIQDKIDSLSSQLCRYEIHEPVDEIYFHFLFGKFQAYHDCLKILKKNEMNSGCH